MGDERSSNSYLFLWDPNNWVVFFVLQMRCGHMLFFLLTSASGIRFSASFFFPGALDCCCHRYGALEGSWPPVLFFLGGLSFFHGEMGREPSSCSPLLVQAVTAMTSEPGCAALGLVGWIGIPSQLDQDRKGETPRGSSSFQAPTYTLQYLQTCVIFGQICRSRCIFSSTNSVEHILTLKSVVAYNFSLHCW